MPKLLKATLLGLLVSVAGVSHGGPKDVSQQELRSLDDQPLRLDAMQINIDRRLATHYIYADKELEALQHTRVQRTATFSFSKGVEPKLLGITLAGPEAIQLGDR